jgi:hypothetical protein
MLLMPSAQINPGRRHLPRRSVSSSSRSLWDWVADADLAAVDLLDDRVQHPVGVLPARQVPRGLHPALQPAILAALAPRGL